MDDCQFGSRLISVLMDLSLYRRDIVDMQSNSSSWKRLHELMLFPETSTPHAPTHRRSAPWPGKSRRRSISKSQPPGCNGTLGSDGKNVTLPAMCAPEALNSRAGDTWTQTHQASHRLAFSMSLSIRSDLHRPACRTTGPHVNDFANMRWKRAFRITWTKTKNPC